RAEAALQPVMVHECLLHRMQPVAVRQTLDRADRLAFGLHCEHQTRAHRRAVDKHRARAADAVFAADMRAGLPAVLADRVGERAPRLDGDVTRAAVDRERDLDFVAHARFSALRNKARTRCGVAGISSISTPKGPSASLIALITAAGAPMPPPSPRPFALVIDSVLGVSM